MSRPCPTCGKPWGLLTGAQMRALRRAARLTLRQMETRSGLSFSYLSKMETEHPKFPVTKAADVAYRSLLKGTP